MARPLRIECPDALYHLTSRGDRQEDIFLGQKRDSPFIQTVPLCFPLLDKGGVAAAGHVHAGAGMSRAIL